MHGSTYGDSMLTEQMAAEAEAYRSGNIAGLIGHALTAYDSSADYIDNVGEYGGSMVAALGAAMHDSYAGPLSEDSFAMQANVAAAQGFAQLYDATLYGQRIGSFGIPGLVDGERSERYSQDDVAQAFGRIRDEWSLDNNNPMYALIGDGRVIDPVEGRDRTSVLSRYTGSHRTGELHGWQGGLATDLATAGQNHPVFTTRTETLVANANPLGWDNPDNPSLGYGLNLRTSTADFEMIYGHLQPGTFAINRLIGLIQATEASGVYRFALPPGFQFGNVGNSGNSFGAHLHWELRPR